MNLQNPKATWKSVVAGALRDLGGEAHLSQIYEAIQDEPKTATNPTWRDTVRRVVRQYNMFEPVPPERSGVYRLVESETPPPQQAQLDSEQPLINHGMAQGMLVRLGAIYGYETFAPKADQTTREFQGRKLGELVTVGDCGSIFRGPNVGEIRQIDVLWFEEDDYGPFPAYAFEVEHTTRIRDGLNRLLKIPRRFAVDLFVLGPTQREKELFDRRVSQSPFREHRERFHFRSYSQLECLYNAAVRHTEKRDEFGIADRHARR